MHDFLIMNIVEATLKEYSLNSIQNASKLTRMSLRLSCLVSKSRESYFELVDATRIA